MTRLISQQNIEKTMVQNSRLAKLSYLAVRFGVNIQKGQPLIISAPVAAVALTEEIAQAAYQFGSGAVQCVYQNPTLLRLALSQMSPNNLSQFEIPSDWAEDAVHRLGAAWLDIWAPDPTMLTGIPVDKIVKLHATTKPSSASKNLQRSAIPFVTEAWACAVHPSLAPDIAVSKLWDAVFASIGMNIDDAVSGDACSRLRKQMSALQVMQSHLEELPLSGLHFRGVGTDLRVGLRPFPRWHSGASATPTGTTFQTNLPLSAITTALNPMQTEGELLITRPIAIVGEIVSGLKLRFSNGKISEIEAASGKDALEQLVNTNDGARWLSGVGLTLPLISPSPHTAGHLCNILDCASSMHVRLGRFDELHEDIADDTMANNVIGIDLAFGSSDLQVDGILQNGSCIALLRGNNFVGY